MGRLAGIVLLMQFLLPETRALPKERRPFGEDFLRTPSREDSATAGNAAGNSPSARPDTSARATNAFAADLYRNLDTAGNLFLSPFSIHSALGMAYAGARGRTGKEMAAVLHFPSDRETPHAWLARLRKRLDSLAAGGRIQINLASAIWTQSGMPLLKPFLDVQRFAYGAEPRPVDFIESPETQRLLINRWAEDETRGKIRNLIPEGIIDSETRMVLGNAIFFKGKWAHPFDTSRTESGTFHLSPERNVQVPLMHLKGRFRYAESDGYSLLELPYEGGDFSLVACLPDTGRSSARAEAAWVRGGMGKALVRLMESRVQDVEGVLPRFRITGAFELSEVLAGMGMPNAFPSGKPDFSGITKAGNLWISAVLHKAIVEVDEEGTEAAAATAAVMHITAYSPSPRTFRADRPFLFLIRENRTGVMLFMGRVADPRG